MPKPVAPLLPITASLLQAFGETLRLARRRRRLPAKQVAERAGMTPMTLRRLERGGPGVTMGAYAAVMQVLGIEQDLALLGKSDPIGRGLQDAEAIQTQRTRSRPSRREARQADTSPAAGPLADGERGRIPMGEADQDDVSARLHALVAALNRTDQQKALVALHHVLPGADPRGAVRTPDAPPAPIARSEPAPQAPAEGAALGTDPGFIRSEDLASLLVRAPAEDPGQ